MNLKDLRESGRCVADPFSHNDSLPSPPPNFDLEKFNRGKKFFQDNVFSCTMAMLTSLIAGLSVNNLLEPLVFTGQSDTPIKSLRRYFRTFQHVLLWHYGNVWDPTSNAHKSINKVRLMHNSVRADMREGGEDVLRVSQYDMSLVQCGFMGGIVMYPSGYGIHCTMADVSDYCYFWYGIGYLLGITDENNICKGDVTATIMLCKEIERDILEPALRDPPAHFYPMAEAFTDGMNWACHCPLFSVQAFLAFGYSLTSIPNPRRLSFKDFLRTLFLQSLIVLVKYVPFCRSLFNRVLARHIDPKTHK